MHKYSKKGNLCGKHGFNTKNWVYVTCKKCLEIREEELKKRRAKRQKMLDINLECQKLRELWEAKKEMKNDSIWD